MGKLTASRRILGLNGDGDDGWGLFYRARAMKAAGTAVAELTIGEHDIRTDTRILEAMDHAAKAGQTGYAPVPGSMALREAVAARATRLTGVPTGPEHVAITPGGQAALFAAHLAVLDPGDRALMIDPYYATYAATIRAADGAPVMVAALPKDGFQPQAAAIAEAASATGARSLLINTPNNPTGVVYSRQTLDGIAEVITDAGMWLISDEVYDSQVWQGAHISPRALPGMAERTLVIGSLSKSHAMTGSRLGWALGPEEIISHLHSLSNTTNYGIPGYIQEAGVYALSLGAAFEAEIGAPFRRRRDILVNQLDGQTALKAAPPEGAMYVMVDVSGTGLSGAGFAERLLETAHIAVMPGNSFGQAGANHVRVALTLPDEEFADAIRRMVAFAATL